MYYESLRPFVGFLPIYHEPTTDVMLSTVEKIAKALHVTLDQLLEMD